MGLFDTGDVLLRLAEGDSIRFHRSILTLASPLFADLMSVEKFEGLDVDGSLPDWIIIRDQLYSSFLPAPSTIDFTQALQTLPLLHKYQLDSILARCITLLSSAEPSIESAFQVLSIAKDLQLDSLFAQTLQLISTQKPSFELIRSISDCQWHSTELDELKHSALLGIQKEVSSGSSSSIQLLLDEPIWKENERSVELDLALIVVQGAALKIKAQELELKGLGADSLILNLWHCLSCSAHIVVFEQKLPSHKTHQPEWLKVVESGSSSSTLHHRCIHCGSSSLKKEDNRNVKVLLNQRPLQPSNGSFE